MLKQEIFCIQLCILFVLLFTVNSKNEYLNSNGPTNFNTDQNDPIRYTLKVNTGEHNQYIKFEVKGEKNVNHVLSVYSDENRSKRIQLAQSFNGITKLFLSKEQNSNENIYIDLECNKTCSGIIDIKYNPNGIELSEGETLSYYVTEQNKIMQFILISNSTYEKCNIWARGQLDIKTTISHPNNSTKSNYYIVENCKGQIQFKVEGKLGDYINTGFIGYKKEQKNNEIIYNSNTKMAIDGAIITGYLHKKNLDKVCYEIEKQNSGESYPLFVTGLILTKIGYVIIKSKNVTNSPTFGEELFSHGILSFTLSSDDINNEKICFGFPPEDKYPQFINIKDMVFIYQITKGESNGYNLYEPQLSGVLYPRYIMKNARVAFIPHIGTNKVSKITMNLLSLNGFPEMSVIECNNYPLCPLTDGNLKNGVKIKNINRFSSYSYEMKNNDYSPISKKQTLFVVECKESEKTRQKESKYFDLMCGFGSLIYKDNDEIQLIEDFFFNQYAHKNQVENFKIKIQGESKIQKIFIDVITYIGDVEVNIAEKKGINNTQYISANKIYTSVKALNPSESLEDIIFSVTALTNTYYTVLYNFGRNEVETDSLITNELQTGLSYLVTIDIDKHDQYEFSNKIVKFANERYFDLMPIMVNFFSLNCEIEVNSFYKRADSEELMYQETKQFGRFVHDLVNTTEERYYNPQLEYRITIREPDHGDYKGKLCKLYASAIEVSNSHDKNTRDILVPDNTPQQIMFGNNVSHVSFGYIHIDFNSSLLIKFDPQQVAQYKVKIFYDGKPRQKGEEIIVDNVALYLDKSEWEENFNDSNKICYIQIDITLENKKDLEDPVLEFSIKSVSSNFVTYLPKNILKMDYVQRHLPQYYYTELGQNENGFVVCNFLRGSGKVYGKVVSKNIKEQNANWRGKYRLPTNNELIEIDPFTKKMDFSTFDVECQNGCYLLLRVFSDIEIAGDQIKNFPYSIMVHSQPINQIYTDIPVISVPTDEYIIGTVDPLDPVNRIFQFYNVWLNKGAKQVAIDFQCDSGGLFINVGFERPTVNNAHFSFISNGTDSIYIITKEQILNKIGNTEHKTIKDFVLTIGVWTNLTDTVYTTPFAFAVRLENNDLIDIYKVNSNQKALCKTRRLPDNKFRCLYVMEYDFISHFNILFIYTSIQKKSAFFKLYAKYIKPSDYEMGLKKNLESLIPSKENNNFASSDLNADFLYITQGLNSSNYLLVSFESNEETIVELMSSFYFFQTEVTPNPSSPQLFMGVQNSLLKLNFPKDNMVMVNIRGIGGSAEIFWNTTKINKYYLKGRDDRLSITSEKSGKDHQLIINSTSNIQHGAGFVFYVTYGIRVDDINFDALILDRSVNYVFSESDLPIIYYAPINLFKMTKNDYYEIFFSFNTLENEVEKSRTYYEYIPFEIVGYIVKEKTIYEAKLTPSLTIDNTNKIPGVYDQALRTGFIRINKTNINNSGISEKEKPYLYLKIQKSDKFKDIRKYKRLGLETSALLSSSNVSISELSYQFGGLYENEEKREYILRTNSKCKYMIIQFSSLNDEISIRLKENKDRLKLIQKNYGKIIYSIETFNTGHNSEIIEIFRNNLNNKKKEYFMFQYINSNDTKYIYSIRDTKIEVTKKQNNNNYNYKLRLYPVDNYKNYDNITYIVRSIYLNNEKEIGSVPKKPDLSLKINEQNVKEFYDPKEEGDGKLTLEITDINEKVLYIQVIAQIQHKEKVEYLSYDLKSFAEELKKGRGRTSLVLALVIGAILLLIVIGLIVTVIIFNNKNKDLLTKVNQVSFADEEKKDDNLLVDNEIN